MGKHEYGIHGACPYMATLEVPRSWIGWEALLDTFWCLLWSVAFKDELLGYQTHHQAAIQTEPQSHPRTPFRERGFSRH